MFMSTPYTAEKAASDTPRGTSSVDPSRGGEQPHSRAVTSELSELSTHNKAMSTRQRAARTGSNLRPQATPPPGERQVVGTWHHSQSVRIRDTRSSPHQRSVPPYPAEMTGKQPAAPLSSRSGRGHALSIAQGTVIGEEPRSTLRRLPEREPAVRSEYRHMYQRAWHVSEQVLAQENIPPGFRTYVKAYFDAIHP